MAPPSFLTSRAVQGYSPQFLDTGVEAPAPVAGAQSPDLTNRLLQIMGGNLAGTLSGGEKLSALGALLKSVSRGSQQSPQQVLQSIQQQKLQETQGAMQIQELRKQAGQQAQRNALREDLLSKARNDQERARIRLLSDENLEKYALQGLENKPPEMEAKQRQLATYYQMRLEDPVSASAYWRLINPTQLVGSIESGIKKYDAPEPPIGAIVGGAAPSRGAPVDGLTDLTTPQPKPTEPTEGERTSAYLYTRAKSGLNNLSNISKKNPEASIPSATEIVTQNIFGEAFANQFKSPARQQYVSAQGDVLDAVLTLATGLTYTPEQIEAQRRAYFAQYGDSPETIKFKESQWSELLKAARLKAGRGLNPPSAKSSGDQRPSKPNIKILSVKPRG